MAKSKSIRIELEQNSNPNQKRKRKDSYKVKITTFREYEVEGNPSDLFGIDPNAKEDDVFDYFAKKAKREDQFSREDADEAEEGLHEDEEGYEEEGGEFKLPEYDDKNRKQTGETNFSSVHNSDFTPPPFSMQDKRSSVPPANPNARLEERIREAKERTNKALNLIKTLRK